MRQFLVITIILPFLCILGCAKKKTPAPPPPPCTAGISQSTCKSSVTGRTFWSRSVDILSEDPRTHQRQLENRLVVVHEFLEVQTGPAWWRRTSTLIGPDNSPQTMVMEGQVLSLDDTKLSLTIDRSSCDGMTSGFAFEPALNTEGGRDLYYRRYGNQLSLRTKPFPPPIQIQSGKGVGDLMGAILVGAVGAVMQSALTGMVDGMGDLLVHMLTFGLLRDQLKEGVGDFTLATQDPGKRELGLIGCFPPKNSKGPFKPAQDQNLYW